MNIGKKVNKINYPEIEKYNKNNYFYDYIKNYIREFKNKKDIIELSYLCSKKTIELTKENNELYENCVKDLKLVKLWLEDENLIDIKELKEIANSISNSAWSIYCAYLTKPELLPYIQKLIRMYLRIEKQFNTKEHNNTYHESILKQIINIEYDELQEIDKNQAIDIINEYYDIEIDCFDFLTHKTIQREFM